MSKYALAIAEDNRIIYATFDKYAGNNTVLVDSLPDGDISDYLYIDGAFVYDPLPEPDPTQEPSQLDRVEAQAVYTAMMTDPLLESEVQSMKEKIAKWYKQGLWTAQMVQNAVTKGKLTAEEAAEILSADTENV